jgi:hypothetical protein
VTPNLNFSCDLPFTGLAIASDSVTTSYRAGPMLFSLDIALSFLFMGASGIVIPSADSHTRRRVTSRSGQRSFRQTWNGTREFEGLFESSAGRLRLCGSVKPKIWQV